MEGWYPYKRQSSGFSKCAQRKEAMLRNWVTHQTLTSPEKFYRFRLLFFNRDMAFEISVWVGEKHCTRSPMYRHQHQSRMRTLQAVCSGGLQSIPSIFQTCEGVRKERAIGGGDFWPSTVSLLKPLTTPCRGHSIGPSAPACHGVYDLLLTALIALYFCSPACIPASLASLFMSTMWSVA